jgi:hypothetical protein
LCPAVGLFDRTLAPGSDFVHLLLYRGGALLGGLRYGGLALCGFGSRVPNYTLLRFPSPPLILGPLDAGGLQLSVSMLFLPGRSRVEAGGTAERVGALGERGPVPLQLRSRTDLLSSTR